MMIHVLYDDYDVIYVKVPFHCVPFLHLGKPAAPGGLGGMARRLPMGKWGHQWLATCGL